MPPVVFMQFCNTVYMFSDEEEDPPEELSDIATGKEKTYLGTVYMDDFKVHKAVKNSVKGDAHCTISLKISVIFNRFEKTRHAYNFIILVHKSSASGLVVND